jgi:2-polyprenyl-6-hydroxyphenyl methylase/3-demethylubiquinone-9 3-methyltransferase
MVKNVICLWYDGTAEDAARFYAQTFPDSVVTAVHRAPGDYPDGKEGQVLTVEFSVLGVPCLGLNGGPAFKHSEAFSFQIITDNQAETDRYWNAIVNQGGTESACGWCKDKWGLSWQITPRALLDATTDPDRAAAICARRCGFGRSSRRTRFSGMPVRPAPQPLDSEERNAFSRLQAAVRQAGASLAATITGPLIASNAGDVLEVRWFSATGVIAAT